MQTAPNGNVTHPGPTGHGYLAEIGDADFNFTQKTFDDAKVTAAQIALAVGRHPIEDYVVLALTADGEIETLRPTETAELSRAMTSRLFVVKGDGTERFFVDGLAMEWPRKTLKAWQVKLLAGAGEDRALVLDSDVADHVFDDDDDVEIGKPGAERFKLKPRKKTVTVTYGDTDFELERRVYTTEQLMAVFGVPAGYLLDFVEANGAFRQMVPGERLKVKDGMEFASHPPVGQSS